jgi:hypothetical protein
LSENRRQQTAIFDLPDGPNKGTFLAHELPKPAVKDRPCSFRQGKSVVCGRQQGQDARRHKHRFKRMSSKLKRL